MIKCQAWLVKMITCYHKHIHYYLLIVMFPNYLLHLPCYKNFVSGNNPTVNNLIVTTLNMTIVSIFWEQLKLELQKKLQGYIEKEEYLFRNQLFVFNFFLKKNLKSGSSAKSIKDFRKYIAQKTNIYISNIMFKGCKQHPFQDRPFIGFRRIT